MKKSIIAVGVALMLLSLLPASVMGAGSAELPSWKVGDRWAIGHELSETINESDMKEVCALIENMTGDGLDNLSMSAKSYSGMWSAFEVVGDDGVNYILKYRSATKAAVEVRAKFSVMTPAPGKYDFETILSADRENRHMEVVLEYSEYVVTEGRIVVSKSNMGIENVTINLNEKLHVGLNGKNLPSVGDYGVFGYSMMYDENSMLRSPFELEYRDVEMSISEDFKLDMWLEMEPGLELADFPLYEGKIWNQTVSTRMGGTYGGSIDAHGLPPMVEDSLHVAIGQRLPVKIEEINTGNEVFNYGKIGAIEEEDNISLACRGVREIKDESGASTEVYLIGEPEHRYCSEYKAGYAAGYERGYYDGLGENDSDPTPPGIHNEGYDDGYYWGYSAGYDDGYYGWGYMSSYYDYCYESTYDTELPVYLMYSPEKEFFAGIYVDTEEMNEGMGSGMVDAEIMKAMENITDTEEEDVGLSFMDYDEAMEKISATEAEMKGENDFLTTFSLVLVLVAGLALVLVGIILIKRRRAISSHNGIYGDVPQYIPGESSEYPETAGGAYTEEVEDNPHDGLQENEEQEF